SGLFVFTIIGCNGEVFDIVIGKYWLFFFTCNGNYCSYSKDAHTTELFHHDYFVMVIPHQPGEDGSNSLQTMDGMCVPVGVPSGTRMTTFLLSWLSISKIFFSSPIVK